MQAKKNFESYTESEFREFVMQFYQPHDTVDEQDDNETALDAIDTYENRLSELIQQFEAVTEHPDGCDLIFYPKEGSGSLESVINEVKQWRAANGRPGFKIS